jgi:hypothetical protein
MWKEFVISAVLPIAGVLVGVYRKDLAEHLGDPAAVSSFSPSPPGYYRSWPIRLGHRRRLEFHAPGPLKLGG